MGKTSRDKGKQGEREVVALFAKLHNSIGHGVLDRNGAPVPVGRNHNQAERGGHDITGVFFFAPEVKRVGPQPSRGQVRQWWEQACQQAEVACKEPMLIYRANNKPWTVCLWAGLNRAAHAYMMEMAVEEFMLYYRDRVNGEQVRGRR
jgi:hypothetical protein